MTILPNSSLPDSNSHYTVKVHPNTGLPDELISSSVEYPNFIMKNMQLQQDMADVSTAWSTRCIPVSQHIDIEMTSVGHNVAQMATLKHEKEKQRIIDAIRQPPRVLRGSDDVCSSDVFDAD